MMLAANCSASAVWLVGSCVTFAQLPAQLANLKQNANSIRKLEARSQLEYVICAQRDNHRFRFRESTQTPASLNHPVAPRQCK